MPHAFLDFAWDGLSGGEQPVGDPTKSDHDPMGQEYVAREEGWIYAYVSNENSTLVEVYFDDVTVTLTKSNLIQYNEYYPFGMQTANSWTRENTLGNNFLANGGTELNTTSNLYDLDYRNYDPVLGRMNGVDPLATSFASITPYNYSFNDPVTFTDPSGAKPEDFDKTDLDLYGGCLTCYYNNGGDFGSSNLLIMDPMGGGNYETWTPVTAGGYGVANAMLYSNEGLINFSVFTNWINERINDRHRPERIAAGINRAWNDDSSNNITIDNSGQELTREVPIYELRVRTMQIESDASVKVIFYRAIIGYKTLTNLGEKKTAGAFLRSNHVSVTFKSGADNQVSKNLANYFSLIMTEASRQGINSVQISSTTNHPTNKDRSAHSAKNGSRAFDISMINGQAVSNSNPNSIKLQKIIDTTPGWMENYGPSFVKRLINGLSTEQDRAKVGSHHNHVHVSIPRK